MSSTPEDTSFINRKASQEHTKAKTSKFKKILHGIRKNGAMGAVAAPPSNHDEDQNNGAGEKEEFSVDWNRTNSGGKLTLSVTSETSGLSHKQTEVLKPPSNPSGDIIRMDKYGFLLSASAKDSPLVPSNGQDLRLHKWQDMLDKCGPKSKSAISFSNTQSKVKYYTRRGLPDSLRRRAWTVLTGVDVILATRKDEYAGLVARAEEEFERWKVLMAEESIQRRTSEVSALGDASVSNSVLETIDRDIHRTFPKHYLFHNGLEDEDTAVSGVESSGVSSGGGSSGVDSDTVDHDSEDEEEEEDVFHSAGDVEITDESKMEKKKLFDDMIGRSLSLTACGGLSSVALEETVKVNNGGKSDIAEQSSIISGAGSTEQHGAGQAALRRILRAYSVYDSEVGYCQGMNFIAAMFLTFLSEEEAFWLLVIVMNEEPYKLRELFGEDMAGTHEVLYIAEKLLQQFLPKLSVHLERESIHVSMFVTQWLLTVYTSTFPFDLVSRVWDSFLVEGWKVVYRVMLSLMETASKDLMTFSFEQILNYFRDFPNTVDGAKIMNASLKIPLKRKHIQKHVTEWRRANVEDNSKNSSGKVNALFKRRDSAESDRSGTIKSQGEGSKSSKTSSMGRFKLKGSREIKVEDYSQQLLPIIGAAKFAVMIHNALTPEECSELIELAEGSGFQPAAIYDAATKTVHRNCTRRILDDSALAENWYERILHALTDTPFEEKIRECPRFGNKNKNEPLRAVSLNERLRINKYAQGQFFTKHLDATFTRGEDAGDREGEKSLISVHIYLNEGYKGGVTRFHGGGRWFDITAKTGSILLFESTILHESAKVTKGDKYVVRSDIMYSSKADLSEVAGTGFTQQL